jgi:putative ABC transport system permease protein
MGTLWQDVRYGARMLVKNPAVSAIAIISLALGIGANTTIFTVVNAVLLNPLPVKDITRLVEVDTTDTRTRVTWANAVKMGVSYPNCRDYARLNEVFNGVACYSFVPLTWSGGAESKQVDGQLVSANYFDVLGLRPALGRFFLSNEDQKPSGNNVAVVSYSFWANHLGGDSSVIGRVLQLNATPFTVIGVAPRGFKGPFTLASPDQIWMPASMYPQVLSGFVRDWFDQRRSLLASSFARLKPGISIGEADASVKTIAAHLASEYPKDNAGRSVVLTPLADTVVGANQQGEITLAGGVLMGVVGLVLLIACVNLANLLLAQSARREREMSLRAALGAGRGRIMRQLVTESMLLALIGGGLGLVIAYWGRTALWSFRPSFIETGGVNLALDWRVLVFTLAVSVFTGVIFGIAPAIKSSRVDLAETLKVGGRGNSTGWRTDRLRSLLVVSEIALAMIALIGAGLFIRSMENAQRMSLGFESRKLFTMNVDLGALHYTEGRGQQFFREAAERAKSAPGVADATVSSNAPIGGGWGRTVFPEGQDMMTGYRGTLTTVDDVTPGYFNTLRIPFIEGRDFSDSDRVDTAPVAVVNEAMATHFWPNENALGKRFHFIDETKLREIVGIVGNTVIGNIGEQPQPVIYMPYAQDYSPFAAFVVRTKGDPQSVVPTVRAQIQSLDPSLAITNVQTIGEIIAQGLWAPRMGAALLGLFGGLALILAAVGVYGVLSYSVAQQTHEIGIRMALGAQPSTVLKLVVGEGLKLAAAGLIVGLIGAVLGARVLSSLLFSVSTYDPVTFVGVSLVLIVAAALACYIPARRATRVDPMVALRQE